MFRASTNPRMFVIRTLEKILAEKELRKSNYIQIKKACTEALALAKSENTPEVVSLHTQTLECSTQDAASTRSSVLPLPKHCADEPSTRTYLHTLELLCTSNCSTRLVVLALDCIQKLIIYGHVSGNYPDTSDPCRQQIDRIVHVVCSCFCVNGRPVSTDDRVHLQVLKVLLTILTSQHVEVHGDTVLLAVRTCYDIYMVSRNAVNQTTARATLTQVINLMFYRMEVASSKSVADSSELPTKSSELGAESSETASQSDSANIVSSNQIQADSRQHRESGENVDDDTYTVVRRLLEDIVSTVGHETEQSLHQSESDVSDKHSTLDVAACNITACQNVKSSVTTDELSTQVDDHFSSFANVYERDAFFVFRTLCKLSMKIITDTSHDSKSHELRSKIMSLSLILCVVQTPGPVMCSHEIFISVLHQYLCISLSKNATSTVVDVFQLSLTIFLALLEHFKQHLRPQIEVFFRDILLGVLDRSAAPFTHRWLALQAVERVCREPATLVHIYITYDCDLGADNLFERLINTLSRLAAFNHTSGDIVTTHHGGLLGETSLGAIAGTGVVGGSSSSSRVTHELHSLRSKALQCLVSALHCMVDCCRHLFVSTNSQTNLDTERENSEAKAVCDSLLVKSIESRKQKKEIWQQGIELFNQKPHIGLQFLNNQHLLDSDPTSVATFLLEDRRLNRAVIGDFLGHPDSYNKQVMYAYVDRFDFAGITFVLALRLFLENFRLPGEAQKIDRLMEKFASRYCECNVEEKLFSSADTAYVLAYSIIMLTTDLHSPQVKRKITKAQYIAMNRGINDNSDLPEEYLSAIYDEIAGNEIRMKEQSEISNSTRRQRHLLPHMEMKQLSTVAESLMQAASHVSISGNTHLHNGSDISDSRQDSETVGVACHLVGEESDATGHASCDHVRLMFRVVWAPCLATFSQILQETNNADIVRYSLTGICLATRIACIFGMTVERDSYIQSLSRFSLLLTKSSSGNSSLHPSPFSTLSTNQQPTIVGVMRAKNLLSIRALINVALSDANYLGASWLHVLRCVSQLELAQLVPSGGGAATGVSVSSLFSAALTGNHRHNGTGSTGSHATALSLSSLASSTDSFQIVDNAELCSTSKEGRLLSLMESHADQSYQTNRNSVGNSSSDDIGGSSSADILNAPISASSHTSLNVGNTSSTCFPFLSLDGTKASTNIVVAVDRIFTNSIYLDGDAIVDFVQALVQVSNEELACLVPRTYSLTKIVEISYYNMGRIRLQWSRIWKIIGAHFNQVGCSPIEEISIFAIDSLRQLSIKFIEKGELANFNFQKEFLRPFEYIMKTNRSPIIHDMIVRCVSQIVHSHSNNIRSGWNNIFAVFHLAATMPNRNVIELAFYTTCEIITNTFTDNLALVVDSFQDALKCLAEFACNQMQIIDVSMEAIRLLRNCANIISSQPDLFVDHCNLAALGNDNESCQIGEPNTLDTVWLRAWFPLLFQISCIINRCQLDVRTRALAAMFDVIKSAGHQFNDRWWVDLFNILFRLFNIMKMPELKQEKSEWITTTCSHALHAMFDVFIQYLHVLEPLLLRPLFKQLQSCILLQDNEQLAVSVTNSLENFFLHSGVHFSRDDSWQITCDCICEIFASFLAQIQTTDISNTSLSFKLSTLTQLILSLQKILFGSHCESMDPEHEAQNTPDSVGVSNRFSLAQLNSFASSCRCVSLCCSESPLLIGWRQNRGGAKQGSDAHNVSSKLLYLECASVMLELCVHCAVYTGACRDRGQQEEQEEVVVSSSSSLVHCLGWVLEEFCSREMFDCERWTALVVFALRRLHSLDTALLSSFCSSSFHSLSRLIESATSRQVRSSLSQLMTRIAISNHIYSIQT